MIEIYLALSAAFLFFFVIVMKTKNLVSAVFFKVIPFFIAIGNFVLFMKEMGWLNFG